MNHPRIHSNDPSGQLWARPKPGAKNSIQSPTEVAESQVTETSSPIQVHQQRVGLEVEWQEKERVFQLYYVGIAGSGFNALCHNPTPPLINLYCC